MTAPLDVCLVIEDGYPHCAHPVAAWSADLVAALAPRRIGLVTIGTESDLPATPIHEVPRHVALHGHVQLGVRGLRVHSLEQGAGAANAAAGVISRMLSRAARERYVEALERIGPLFRAVALGDVALEPIEAHTQERRAALDTALEILAGEGPWGLNARALFEGELAQAALTRAGAREGQSAADGLNTAFLVRAMLEPLAHLLTVKLPPAKLYYAVGGSFAALCAIMAARRHDMRPVILAETSWGLERRLLQLHRGLELGAFDSALELERRQEDAALVLHRLALERADVIVATSEHDRRFLVQCGAPLERTVVIRPGSSVAPPPDGVLGPPPLEQRPWLIANAGALDPIHDTLSFVRSARELIERLDLVRFVSIGSLSAKASYYHACVEELRALTLLPLFTFVGPRFETEILAQLHALIATALGARGAPALPEALALGLPVVAVDTPPNRELLAETADLPAAGLLAPAGSPAALADQVVRLFEDRALRNRLIAAGKERARRELDRKRLLARHLELIDRACNDQRLR